MFSLISFLTNTLSKRKDPFVQDYLQLNNKEEVSSSCAYKKELSRVNMTYNLCENQKVNFLVIQKFNLNYAVLVSKFIKAYI